MPSRVRATKRNLLSVHQRKKSLSKRRLAIGSALSGDQFNECGEPTRAGFRNTIAHDPRTAPARRVASELVTWAQQ